MSALAVWERRKRTCFFLLWGPRCLQLRFASLDAGFSDGRAFRQVKFQRLLPGESARRSGLIADGIEFFTAERRPVFRSLDRHSMVKNA